MYDLKQKIEYTDWECTHCVNHLFCDCDYSYHNAACSFTAQDWRNCTLESLEKYAARVKEYYKEQYEGHLRQIDKKLEEIREFNAG